MKFNQGLRLSDEIKMAVFECFLILGWALRVAVHINTLRMCIGTLKSLADCRLRPPLEKS